MNTIAAFLLALSSYCGLNGPGIGIEAQVYNSQSSNQNNAASCFKKIWDCAQKTQGDEMIFYRPVSP